MSGWEDGFTVPETDGIVVLDEHGYDASNAEPIEVDVDEPRRPIRPGSVPDQLGEFGWIYFVGAQELGCTKIGFTGGDPRKRIRNLQTACPFPLQIHGVMPGFMWTEKRYHAEFAGCRRNGEWFSNTPAIVRLIERQRTSPEPSVIDELSRRFNVKTMAALCREMPVFSSILFDIADTVPVPGFAWCRREAMSRRFVPLIEMAESHLCDGSRPDIGGLPRKVFARRLVSYLLPVCECHKEEKGA